MPVGAFRTQFFFRGSTSAPPAGTNTEGLYHHLYQPVIISMNSGFAGVWIPFLWLWGVLKWAWRIAWMKGHKRMVMEHAYRCISGEAFPLARKSVAETSHAQGFRRKTAWADLSHKIKDRPSYAENTWRHLNAYYLTEDKLHESTLAMVDRATMNLLVELAYHHYSVSPRMSSNGYV